MNMYLVRSTAPKSEHVHAFRLWTQFYGHGWPCSMNLLCPVAEEAQVMPWTIAVDFNEEDPTMVIGTVHDAEEEDDE